MDTNSEYLFDSYFEDINLNNELKAFYEFLNDETQMEIFNEETKLIDIRNENYKRYNDINLLEIENLSDYFEDIVNEIKKIYSFIDPTKILNNDMEESIIYQKILDSLYNNLDNLKTLVKEKLEYLEKYNNEKQEQIKNADYSNIDSKTLQKILNEYNDIVLYNASIDEIIYENYRRQLKRKNDLDKLYKLINIEMDPIKSELSELDKLNAEIQKEIRQVYNKISYLEDLMIEKSKYENEFIVFKDYFINLIAYDDNSYTDISRVHNLLCVDHKIKSLISYFEDSFISEREKVKNEEEFIYEKYGIKNIKKSLDYISANYMDYLNSEEKNLIDLLYKKLNDESDINELYQRLKRLVVNIWKNTLTSISNFNENSDFYFICTNNQFIDEKHESILITKRMLERVQDYSDYQIGFICNYDDNILYITENEDIMTIDYNDMSNLKTPKQLEQEFLNFKVCNRLALNGYITKVSAVYFINDGDNVKYKKAVTLSNQYKLPLIILKKDKN